MKNKILLFLLGNILPQGIIAVVFIIVAKILTKKEFGEFVIIDSLFQLLVVVFLFGNDKAIERLSFDPKSNNKFDRDLLLGTVGLSTIIATAFIGASLLVGADLKRWTGIHFLSEDMTIAILVAGWIGAIFQLIISYEYKRLNALGVLLLRIGRAAIYTLLLFYMINVSIPPVDSKIYSEMLALSAPALAYLVFKYYNSKGSAYSNLYAVKGLMAIRDSSSYSLPFFLAVLSSIALNNVDKFFINKIIGTEELATYAIAQKFSLVYIMVAGGIAAITPPIFFRTFPVNSGLAYHFADKVLAIVFICLICFALAAQLILPMIFEDTSSEILMYLLAILPGAYFSIAVSYGPVLCLLQDKRSFVNMLTGIAAAGINVLILYVALPYWGVWGAVIAYDISLAILLFLQLYSIQNNHSAYPLGIGKIALLLVFVCMGAIFVSKGWHTSIFAFYSYALALIALGALATAKLYRLPGSHER